MRGAAELSGWGNFPRALCRLELPRERAEVEALLARGDLIARGLGRAYGDAALNPRLTVGTARLGRMLAFDPGTGLLEAEAGVQLSDIIATFLPRGWFPAVVPGTGAVTLGGMIAADVHGKNHHRDGSLRNAVDWVEVLGPDGAVRRAGPGEALFDWTLGGMGLTGVILRAALRLRPVETGWIRQETLAVPDLAAAMQAMAGDDGGYSAAWIDALAGGPALGRGLVMRGDHALAAELPPGTPVCPELPPPRRLPVPPAPLLVSAPPIRAANRHYHRRGAARHRLLVPWRSFFFPLDAVAGWNRIYGRRGFVQFQCVLPPEAGAEGLAALLAASAGQGAALAVLKRMGPGGGGLSFAMAGWTLALDLAMRPGTPALLSRLDAITLDHAGRFYLAKDARLSAETLTRSDPRVEPFREARRANGWSGAFRSLLSERLEL